jgi:hypothetical protein
MSESVKSVHETVDLLGKVRGVTDTIYDVYAVEGSFNEYCLGGKPKSLDTALAVVDARVNAGKLPEEAAEAIREQTRSVYLDDMKVEQEEGLHDPEKPVEKTWCTFFRDDNGLYLESRVVKTALRESMQSAKLFKNVSGTKTQHNMGLFVDPPRVYFTRDGKPITEPDGFLDSVAIIEDRNGKRTAIKRSDYTLQATIAFEVSVVAGGAIGIREITGGLAVMEKLGLGAMRSQGFGQITWTRCELIRTGVAVAPPKEAKPKKAK